MLGWPYFNGIAPGLQTRIELDRGSNLALELGSHINTPRPRGGGSDHL